MELYCRINELQYLGKYDELKILHSRLIDGLEVGEEKVHVMGQAALLHFNLREYPEADRLIKEALSLNVNTSANDTLQTIGSTARLLRLKS